MTFDVDTLFELLPAHLRVEDARIGALRKAELGDASDKPLEDFGPLRTLISIVATEVGRLEEALDQLYDDHFIETCADWVAPYIGDLVGARGAYDLGEHGLSARALVADAIRLRRRKGTAAAFEQVAAAATLWDAVAVEFFQRVAIAQSTRLPRPRRNATVDLRDRVALRRVGTAFDTTQRTVEVRRIATAGGRWNLPNIGAFLWRTGARPRNWGAAARVAQDRRDFFFHPLGIDHPLWAPRSTADARDGRRTIAHVPRPIERADMRQAIDEYWGRAIAVRIRARGAPGAPPLDPQTVRVCDLPDAAAGPGFRHSPSVQVTRVDPVRGRLVLSDAVPLAADSVVEVFYHEGAALDLGGGGYERANRIDASIAGAGAVGADDDIAAAVAQALADPGGALRIESNALHAVAGGAVALADDARVAIGAGNGFAPYLRPAARFDITAGGATGATLVLSGLAIAGGLRIGAGVRRLVLADVTLVPGHDRNRDGAPTAPAEPSLILASDGCRVEIVRSILGPIAIEEDDIEIDIAESIVVADAANAAAIASAAGVDGERISMRQVTVVGRVAVGAVGEISDSILYGHADAPASAFTVQRLQTGCVRFCALPPRARAPRRFRCVPAGPDDMDAPAFASLAWPGPAFGRLRAVTPRSIREGASDGGEIGVYGVLKQRAREVNLAGRLAEFTPFGMEAGFFYES